MKSIENCQVFRELSRCQSFECSWGLNVLLTPGNRSWLLFPSYRRRQRLCVLMCVRTGHVGTCLFNLYHCVKELHAYNQLSNTKTPTCTWYACTSAHRLKHGHTSNPQCGCWPPETLTNQSIPANNCLMAMTLIIDWLSFLIKCNLCFHYVWERLFTNHKRFLLILHTQGSNHSIWLCEPC